MSVKQSNYGFPSPTDVGAPKPIIAQRAPATTDTGFEAGTVWVDQSANAIYILSSVAAGAADWEVAAGSSADVNQLAGDSGTAVPAAGTINILGGTNLTTVGGSPTADDLTVNMDAAISLATSVTSPLYTTASGNTSIFAAAGGDINIRLGDNAGGDLVRFQDSDDLLVASVDSLGNISATATVFGDTFETSNVTSNLRITDNNITAFGSDADVGIEITPKGTGMVVHSRALVGDPVQNNITNSDDTDPASHAALTINTGGTSGGDPKLEFTIIGGTQAFVMGIDNSTGNDDFVISNSSDLGTTDVIVIDGSTSNTDFLIGNVHVDRSAAGVDVTVEATNSDNTDPASNAIFEAAVGGTSAGDPSMNFLISGGQSFTIGIDNSSTNDDFVISDSTALGTNDRLVIDGSTGDTLVQQNLIINGAAKQLQVQGGAATDFIGSATLVAGTVTVSNTNIAATDRIFVTRVAVGASTVLGEPFTSIIASTSFTIEARQTATPGSIETNDVSTFRYFIVREI